MSALLQTGALVCTVLGLLAAAAVLARSRDGRLGVKVLLEFLVAAGLLRLADDPSWRQVVTAAAVIAVRRLLATALARS